MDAKELNEFIEEPFNVPDLAQLWPEILQQHKNMGFSLPLTDCDKGGVLTDNQMLSEFQWIYGQYRKYIGTKKGVWLPMVSDLEKLLANIKNTVKKDSVTPKDRPELVYQTMRNQWLTNTWNHYAWLKEQLTENKEDDDGWQ